MTKLIVCVAVPGYDPRLEKWLSPMYLDTGSREFTAFTTQMGLYQRKVLPIGMKTFGAVFKQLMDLVLGDLQPKIAVLYFNNKQFSLPS